MSNIAVLKPRVNLTVQGKVDEFNELKAQIKALKEKRDALKDELKTYLQPDNCIYNAIGHKIASLSVHNRKYCKVKQFLCDYPEGFDKYFYSIEIETLRTP